MGLWRRIGAGPLLAAACLAAALYGVAGASADEIDDAFAAIAAASADEKRIAAELDGLREELAAVRLRIDVPGMEPDDPLAAEANRIDEALAGAYDALAQLGTEQARVNRERAILEAWLETFGPAAGNLGLRQFQALTGELAGLRAAGTIPSAGPALGSAPAVRQRLRELIGTAEQLGTRDDAERARLHAEIEALQRERDALELQRSSAPIRFDAAVLSAWQELSRAVAIRGAELQGVRDRIQSLAEQVVLLLGRTGPPYLVELHASTTGGPVYYHARWEAARQGNGDESLKARRLIDAERALIQALGEIGSTREALREPRQYLGEQMAVQSEIINEAAADWSTYKQRGIVVVAMVDIVMTVVETAAGNAPGALAGKSAELALALEKMTGARVAANALLEAGPRAAGELAELVAESRATRNQAIRAVRGAFTVLVEEATEQEVAKGTPRAMAALLAERRLLPLQEQVIAKVSRQLSEESSAVLADAQAELLNTIQREAAAAGMDITSVLNDPTLAKAIADGLLKEGITGPGAKAAAAGIGTLYDDQLSRALGADGDIVGHTSELANTLIGDLVENGLKTIAYGAFGADGLSREALARFTSFRGAGGQVLGNIKAGYSANATGTLISLVSTAVKSGAAAYYDLKTNAASDRFWQAFAASETLQRRYNALIADDKVLWDIELRLKHALLAVQAELAMLRGDREKVVLADQPVPAVDTRVELLFTFSTGLAEPPLLQNGDFSRPMQPVGPLPARTWTAPTLGCYLEDGQITAALGPGSQPFAALDADPTRPAVKEPGIPEPRNYEAGPDRNHIIKLAFDRGPVPGRSPLEGCWIGMGGYLLLQPSGDGWSGWIGHPHSHQQLNDITIDVDRLTAKVLAPDGSPDTDLDLAAQTRRRLAGKWVLRNTFEGGREVPAQYVRQPWELQPPPQ